MFHETLAVNTVPMGIASERRMEFLAELASELGHRFGQRYGISCGVYYGERGRDDNGALYPDAVRVMRADIEAELLAGPFAIP